MNQYQYEVGDIIRLKKGHPCGSSEWEILRVGADFRLKCMGCGHQIMIARKLVEKNTKEIQKKACKSKQIVVQYQIVIYYNLGYRQFAKRTAIIILAHQKLMGQRPKGGKFA